MFVVIEQVNKDVLGCFVEPTREAALAKARELAEEAGRDDRDAEDCLHHEDAWDDKNDPDYRLTIKQAVVSDVITRALGLHTITWRCPNCRATLKTPAQVTALMLCPRCLSKMER